VFGENMQECLHLLRAVIVAHGHNDAVVQVWSVSPDAGAVVHMMEQPQGCFASLRVHCRGGLAFALELSLAAEWLVPRRFPLLTDITLNSTWPIFLTNPHNAVQEKLAPQCCSSQTEV